MLNEFSSGTFLVRIIIMPPLKSAGYSGADDFTTTRFSSCEEGSMSKEKERESASELGTAAPFIHTLLYRCGSPRTMTNLPSMMLMPGTRRITSEASLSCVRVICCEETPTCVTRLVCWSYTTAASEPPRRRPVTTTSDSIWLSGRRLTASGCCPASHSTRSVL